MNGGQNKEYDAVIIGAGISGLVCGCYLAKAGMKVLVIERRANVGGCCTSFTTNGFTFDAFAHSVGGLRRDGTLEIVLRELEINERFKFERHDPSDIIIAPEHKIYFYSNLTRVTESIKSQFPSESSNINNLIKYFVQTKGSESVGLMNANFASVIRNFITDEKLIAMLSLPVLGNVGLPPSLISAFTAIKLYQEFHLDGGYYPTGGMQALPDLLANRLREYGGRLLLSESVKKILMSENGNRVCGIETKKGEKIVAGIIISNCDATQTFNELINDNGIRKPATERMEPSISIFSLFVGTDAFLPDISSEFNSSVWYMLDYDVENMYYESTKGIFERIHWFLIHTSPDKKGFVISILAPFMDKRFWDENRERIGEKLFTCALQNIPFLNTINVKFRTTLTPQSIYKWTLNLKGAVYGWASTPSQFTIPGFTQNTSISGLYLTGHWTTQTLGVSGVAYMGRSTAKIIMGNWVKN